jgi:hypothetical protein
MCTASQRLAGGIEAGDDAITSTPIPPGWMARQSVGESIKPDSRFDFCCFLSLLTSSLSLSLPHGQAVSRSPSRRRVPPTLAASQPQGFLACRHESERMMASTRLLARRRHPEHAIVLSFDWANSYAGAARGVTQGLAGGKGALSFKNGNAGYKWEMCRRLLAAGSLVVSESVLGMQQQSKCRGAFSNARSLFTAGQRR